QGLLEFLDRDPLHLQPAADLIAAEKAAPLLELGGGFEGSLDRLVGDREAEAPGLEGDQALRDQGVESLLLEPQAAEGRGVEPALVEALVEPPLALEALLELPDGDGQAAHRGQHLARAPRIHPLERRDIEDDEGGDDEPEETVEPAPVAAHEAEGHVVSVAVAAGRRYEAPGERSQNRDSSPRVAAPQ